MNDHISKELEKMDLPEAALDIIENLQSRTQAAEEMADAANRQAQQAIQQLYDEKEHIRKERVEIVRERNNRVNEYRIRAEAAEQERDKLIENINSAIGVLNMMQPGRFDKQTVIDMLERIIKEGSKPDEQ